MKPNTKRKFQEPFLRMKWKIKERAKVMDAYYSVRSISEIIDKRRECYKELLREERRNVKDQARINNLEGQIVLLDWLFSSNGTRLK